MHPSGQGVLLLHRRGEAWQGTLGLCFQAGFTPCIPPPPGKILERNLRAEPAHGSSFSRPKARDVDFPWLRHWQAGRRESLGQTSRIQGFIRKCLLARPETLHGEECPRDEGRVLSQTAQ